MNDHEFDRIFRDRLYAQSYRPRQQVWKQLRLRWRNRIAARQWRWFSSAAVVVVVGVVVVTASTKRGANSAAAVVSAASGAGAVREADAARGGDAASGTGAARAADAVAGSGAIAAREAIAASGGRIEGGVAEGPRGVEDGGGTGQPEDRLVGRPSQRVPAAQSLLPPMGVRAPLAVRVPQGVQLPQLAVLASRGGVQLPARAKAAHIGLPERHRKDAAPLWNGWSGEAFGSPDVPTAQFNFSWTAGFRVSRIFATHYSITTGLQYSTVNVRRGDWSRLVLYPPHFDNVDLPLLLGYSTGGQRVRLSAYAGGIFSLYSHATGDPGFTWSHHTAPSLYLGLDLAYRLNERWALFVQPYGRSLFGSGSKSLLQGGTMTEGALLGIRFRFNP